MGHDVSSLIGSNDTGIIITDNINSIRADSIVGEHRVLIANRNNEENLYQKV